MKIYAIVSGEGYQIKTVEETEKAYKITWDFEAGTMSVATEESAITIPTVRYTYDEMCHKLNVNYYINYYEGTQLETGVTATPKKTAQTIKPSKGYDGLKQVAIEATPLETKSATPTTSEQEIVATTTGKIGLSKVTVAAVTSSIDANIVAGNIKNGVTILGVEGTYDVPTLPNEEWAIYNYVNSSASTELELLQALSVEVATGLYQYCLNYGGNPLPNIVKGTNLLATFNITLKGDDTMEFVSSTGTYEGTLGYDSGTGEDTFTVTQVTV